MAESNFEHLVNEEMRKLKDACIALPLGDSHRHAEMRGKYLGYENALKLFKDAARQDLDGEREKF